MYINCQINCEINCEINCQISIKLMPRMMHINYCLCNTHMLVLVHSLEESVTTVRTLQRNVQAQGCAYCTHNLLLHLLIVCQIGNVL